MLGVMDNEAPESHNHPSLLGSVVSIVKVNLMATEAISMWTTLTLTLANPDGLEDAVVGFPCRAQHLLIMCPGLKQWLQLGFTLLLLLGD